MHSVVAFYRASRPGQRYFINSFNEFAEYLKLVNPAAAEANPAGIQWLATSSWEAFWCTFLGKSWRGVHRLRANSFLMTLVKSLGIIMPPDEGAVNRLADIQIAIGDMPRVRFALAAHGDPAVAPQGRGRRGAVPPLDREAMVELRARAREARAARFAARDQDEVLANQALERVLIPALLPLGLAGPNFHPLGQDRPAMIHHRAGFDLMLQDHRSEGARRGWMRMMFALQTDREADILYANLRRAYNLDMVNPEVQPTPIELERMQLMRNAWALFNDGRQALMAAQAHQLPVAVFDLPDPDAPVPADGVAA